MRFKIAAAVAMGLLLSALALQVWQQSRARAEEKRERVRVEHKVVFSPVEHVVVRESRTIDGKAREIVPGPMESAEAITKQFNGLAAEGWEYVGLVTPTGKEAAGDRASGVLTVFKRAKQ